MIKVYIAAPLFSSSEQKFNLELKFFIEEKGFDTYLPQLDGGILSDMLVAGVDLHLAKSTLFDRDLQAIKESEIVLFLLDGRVPDEGGCVEVGIAYALGKICIGFKTDARTFIANEDNVMISGVLNNQIARSFDELGTILIGASRQISFDQ
jgi:nucleoside 2-deoxyribosyltransferase